MRQEIIDRSDRAIQMDLEVFVLERDPIVVSLESDSGNEYTIVPNVAYCSCKDRQMRQYPCKHLIRLASASDVDEDVQEATRRGLAHRADKLLDEIDDLELRLDELRERRAMWNDAWQAHGENVVNDPGSTTSVSLDAITTEPEGESYSTYTVELENLDEIASVAKTAEAAK